MSSWCAHSRDGDSCEHRDPNVTDKQAVCVMAEGVFKLSAGVVGHCSPAHSLPESKLQAVEVAVHAAYIFPRVCSDMHVCSVLTLM